MSNTMKRRLPMTVVATLLTVAALCVTAQGAAADLSSCSVSQFGCSTGVVSANSSTHSVNVTISALVSYAVIDKDNGITVNSGFSFLGTNKTIRGLFGRYYIFAAGSFGSVTISN
ncbi:MAG TPA: hypothetical protein VGO80_21200 [Solirubrobacteraceae bacterium]|nr:hypothetical protein [Solirubrobacteraceae bacterium]